MRKALVVGIDHYDHISQLYGCVNDARAVRRVLARHGVNEANFGVISLTAAGPEYAISRTQLKDSIRELFSGNPEIALFYFAGHGHIETTGGYIIASDSERGDDGVPLNEVMALASRSQAKNKVIILDSCHSGIAGADQHNDDISEIPSGFTLLTASTDKQYANEQNGSGVFTSLLVDAMEGAAANLVGDITPGSVYAHIDQSLGPWKQRPVFKTNVEEFVSLRKVKPPIETEILLKITKHFPTPNHVFQLDPGFEPESDKPDPNKTPIFEILQSYNRVNLLVPNDEKHMYFAAMNSKSCQLTALGKHYWRLVKEDLI